jgi:hypothetical protein
MEDNISRLVQNLDSEETNVLLKLYYNKDGIVKGYTESDFEEETLHDLVEKNLVITNMVAGESVVSLTNEGLDVCGTIMYSRVNEKNLEFKTEIQVLPERAVACLVNRVLWRDIVSKEDGLVDPTTKIYALDESLWYERVLLKDKRIGNTLEKFYKILEDVGFVKNIEGQRWCSPEVENYLREEYRDIMGLTWTEEDSLKYYYFFYIYAQDQKNLINFSGDGEEYRSMFLDESSIKLEYMFSPNQSDPHTLISALGVSEKRATDFLEEMLNREIVSERYYPLSSFSFFGDDDKIYVIKDIKKYIEYITSKFLTPVVDSLLK